MPLPELPLGFIPIDERFLTGSDALFALTENLSMPFRRFKAVRLTSKIRPDRLHGAKLFRRGHLVERKDGIHGD